MVKYKHWVRQPRLSPRIAVPKYVLGLALSHMEYDKLPAKCKYVGRSIGKNHSCLTYQLIFVFHCVMGGFSTAVV